MTSDLRRRETAVRSIRTARSTIVRIAAAWEAEGAVDTTPLTEALIEIQKALAHVEAPVEPVAKTGPAKKAAARKKPRSGGRGAAGSAARR